MGDNLVICCITASCVNPRCVHKKPHDPVELAPEEYCDDGVSRCRFSIAGVPHTFLAKCVPVEEFYGLEEHKALIVEEAEVQ